MIGVIVGCVLFYIISILLVMLITACCCRCRYVGVIIIIIIIIIIITINGKSRIQEVAELIPLDAWSILTILNFFSHHRLRNIVTVMFYSLCGLRVKYYAITPFLLSPLTELYIYLPKPETHLWNNTGDRALLEVAEPRCGALHHTLTTHYYKAGQLAAQADAITNSLSLYGS